MLGVIDACFVIDWANYRGRRALKRMFKLLYVHEEVLEQIRTRRAVEFVGELFSEGVLRIYPWSESEESEFLRLRDEVVADPRIPSLERPDILCLVIARSLNAPLLTENLGVHRVVQFHPRYAGLRVWTALELLENMVYAGVLSVGSPEEFLELVREYEQDTAHVFKRRRLEEVLERVRRWLGK